MSLVEENQIDSCLERPCRVRSLFLRKTVENEELETQLERITTERDSYKEAALGLMESLKLVLRPDNAAMNFMRERLEPIQNVVSLKYSVSENIINLQILIRKPDLEDELRIADSLSELFSIFTGLRFDFSVIPIAGTNLEDLPSEGIPLLSR